MTLPVDWLGQIKAVYPKRRGDQGWGNLKALVPRAVAAGADFERMLLGASKYAKHCDREGLTGTAMVKQAATYFGRGEWWEEWADMDLRTPAEIAAEAKWADLERRAKALGFKEVSRAHGLAVAERAIEAEEAKLRTNVVQMPSIRRVGG